MAKSTVQAKPETGKTGKTAKTAKDAGKTIRFERVYDAPVAVVWDLWTTKEGIESWWGPDGFTVTVQRLELRPGGSLDYTMTATAPPQVEFMRAGGQPLEQRLHCTYTEVTPRRRLSYEHRVDFVPGTHPFDLTHLIELTEGKDGVTMALTVDAMPDPLWNQRMEAGWTNEFEKLARALGKAVKTPKKR